MRPIIIKLASFALLSTITACNSTKHVFGTYRSNFAVIGFFGTSVTLKSDSTFGYRMRGDLANDTANGKYTTNDKFLLLSYDPPKIDTTLYANYGKQAVLVEQALANSYASGRPKIFYIRHDKLYTADTSRNVFRTEQGLSKHKRFLLWGQHYMTKKRYFLKRVD